MRILILVLSFLLTNHLFGQDQYDGVFSENEFFLKTTRPLPIGKHIGKDENEGITIQINYGKQAIIEEIIVMINEDTICHEVLNFPDQKMKWTEIKEGLWINSAHKEENLTDTYRPSDEIKMHYAGFLETGTPFDNSFIRNQPLEGKLAYFIEGFSVGAVNVMPNTVRVLKIDSKMAYGEEGRGNIPPNAKLYYVIYNIENPRA